MRAILCEAVIFTANGRQGAPAPSKIALEEPLFTPHRALIIGEVLVKLDYLDEVIARLSAGMEKMIASFSPHVELLKTIPGVEIVVMKCQSRRSGSTLG
jgi:hypothetical protein